MSPEAVVNVGQQALIVTALLAAPMLLSALAVGLVVGMFQAATQINEMTLSFIPKLLVLAASIYLGGSWMLRLIVGYTTNLDLAGSGSSFTDNSTPPSGYWYLVKPDCAQPSGSWQTAPGAEPDRDASLP